MITIDRKNFLHQLPKSNLNTFRIITRNILYHAIEMKFIMTRFYIYNKFFAGCSMIYI